MAVGLLVGAERGALSEGAPDCKARMSWHPTLPARKAPATAAVAVERNSFPQMEEQEVVESTTTPRSQSRTWVPSLKSKTSLLQTHGAKSSPELVQARTPLRSPRSAKELDRPSRRVIVVKSPREQVPRFNVRPDQSWRRDIRAKSEATCDHGKRSGGVRKVFIADEGHAVPLIASKGGLGMAGVGHHQAVNNRSGASQSGGVRPSARCWMARDSPRAAHHPFSRQPAQKTLHRRWVPRCAQEVSASYADKKDLSEDHPSFLVDRGGENLRCPTETQGEVEKPTGLNVNSTGHAHAKLSLSEQNDAFEGSSGEDHSPAAEPPDDVQGHTEVPSSTVVTVCVHHDISTSSTASTLINESEAKLQEVSPSSTASCTPRRSASRPEIFDMTIADLDEQEADYFPSEVETRSGIDAPPSLAMNNPM